MMFEKPDNRIRRTLLFGLCLATALNLSSQMAIRPGLQLAPLKRVARSADRPTSLDNSLSPYFPFIIDQYGGSCAQASGIHYLFTYEMNRMLERPVNNIPDRIFSYRWTWHFLNGGVGDGSFASDGIEITQTAGCMLVSDFGSQEEGIYRWTTGYRKYYNAMHYKTREMSEISLKTREGIETLMDYMTDKGDGHPGGGIASFSLSDSWGYKTYDGPSETGYDEIMTLDGSGGAHALTLVGYDLSVEYDFDKDGVICDFEKGAFILVNSWGTWWGSQGRAYIPFSFFLTPSGEGGLSEYNSKALCINTVHEKPMLTMSVKIKYSSRNDLVIRFGLADGAQGSAIAKGCSLRYPFPLNQGGDFYMQGTSFASGQDIEMGFNLSSLAASMDTMTAPCFLLIISKTVLGKSGTGYVYEACIHDYRGEEEVTYKRTFDETMGAITAGTHYFRIPTKPWVKNRRGEWLEQSTTSASPVEFSLTDKKTVYSVRTADGNYGNIQLSNYDYSTGKLNLKVTYYEK